MPLSPQRMNTLRHPNTNYLPFNGSLSLMRVQGASTPLPSPNKLSFEIYTPQYPPTSSQRKRAHSSNAAKVETTVPHLSRKRNKHT